MELNQQLTMNTMINSKNRVTITKQIVMKHITILLLLITICACKEDPCEETNCLNGGECIEGICECPEGFGGENCASIIQRIKNESHNGQLLFTYEYLENGNIASIISSQISYTFEYRTDTIIKHYMNHINNQEGFTEYSLLNDKSVKSQSYYDGTIDLEYNLYSNFNEACGYETQEFINGINNQVISTGTKTFTDSFCSFSHEIVFNADNSTFMIIEVINDDGNYYGASSLLPFFGNVQYGNIVSFTQKDGDGEIDLNNSYSAEFIYDDNNFPTSEVRTSLAGSVTNITYEYY